MINQIELAEKFEQIFTDKEIHEYYEKWWAEKNKNSILPSTLSIWDAFTWIIIFGVLFSAWYTMLRDRVEQEVRDGNFITYVWKDMNIIKSTYTPIDQVTDSLKTAQYNEGEKLLKILK